MRRKRNNPILTRLAVDLCKVVDCWFRWKWAEFKGWCA